MRFEIFNGRLVSIGDVAYIIERSGQLMSDPPTLAYQVVCVKLLRLNGEQVVVEYNDAPHKQYYSDPERIYTTDTEAWGEICHAIEKVQRLVELSALHMIEQAQAAEIKALPF